MGLLRSLDLAIEARRLFHKFESVIRHQVLDAGERSQLLEHYWRIWDLMNDAVEALQTAVVPDGETVAVTFLASTRNEGKGPGGGYHIPRRGGDPRGTLLLPSSPLNNDPSDEQVSENRMWQP